ncbi:MAG TPA: site-specific integrase [Ignavibacteriales bacterium]|nr:site-specific integrase [Ignavibacteriales bacterium]
MAFHYRPKQSKTWRIGWYDDLTGKLRSKSAKTRIEAEAKKQARDETAKQRLKIQDDRLITPGDHRHKLTEAFRLFLSQNDFSDKTIKAHKTALDHLIAAAGDKYLYQYNQFDMFALNDRLNAPRKVKKKVDKKIVEVTVPRAANSKANYTRHLNVFFNWLVEKKFIKENIIELREGEDKEVSIIPEEDLEKIWKDIKKINPKYYDILKLAYFGAYRAGEVLEARVEDFDLENNILIVRNSKGGRKDFIPMVKDLKEHIQSMKLPASGRLTTLTYSGIRSFWERCMVRVKKDYTLHQLRKTRGTELANMGVDALFLQKYMRHEDFKTTQQYYIKIDIQKAEENINHKLEKKNNPDNPKKNT